MEKQPTEQGLKASGLAIGRRIPPPGAPAGPVATAAHKIALYITELLVKPLKSSSLGISTHHLHNFLVQGLGATRTLTALKAVMKFPDSIT